MNDNPGENRFWRKLAPDVFVASVFDENQCDDMLSAVENQRIDVSFETESPNSMQDYGTVVRAPALLKSVVDIFNREVKRPVNDFFEFLPHTNFSENHAFLTVYGDEGNPELALHVDALHVIGKGMTN